MKFMKYGAKAIKQAKLELWPNPNPDRDYVIDISYPEFTCDFHLIVPPAITCDLRLGRTMARIGFE